MPSDFTLGGELLRLEDRRVDPRDEDLLVVRPVVDADPAALRHRLERSPEVVVVAFLGRRRLEAENLATLRVDAAHDVADGAILARGIHRLEHQQDAVGVLCVQPVLLGSQHLDTLLQQPHGLLLVFDASGPLRVVVLQRDLLARSCHQLLHQVLGFFHRCPLICSDARNFKLTRGASLLGLPDTLSRSPLSRLAPFAWLARDARSHLGTSVRFMRRLLINQSG